MKLQCEHGLGLSVVLYHFQYNNFTYKFSNSLGTCVVLRVVSSIDLCILHNSLKAAMLMPQTGVDLRAFSSLFRGCFLSFWQVFSFACGSLSPLFPGVLLPVDGRLSS